MTRTRLLGADFSAVESVGLAWLVGEAWKVDRYKEFFATGDPAIEPYRIVGGLMLGRPVLEGDKVGRQIGKTGDLGCGYGGGCGAVRRITPDDPRTDEELTQFIVRPWRRVHPATVRYWPSFPQRWAGAPLAISLSRK